MRTETRWTHKVHWALAVRLSSWQRSQGPDTASVCTTQQAPGRRPWGRAAHTWGWRRPAVAGFHRAGGRRHWALHQLGLLCAESAKGAGPQQWRHRPQKSSLSWSPAPRPSLAPPSHASRPLSLAEGSRPAARPSPAQHRNASHILPLAPPTGLGPWGALVTWDTHPTPQKG